jgi:hypothetical protein
MKKYNIPFWGGLLIILILPVSFIKKSNAQDSCTKEKCIFIEPIKQLKTDDSQSIQFFRTGRKVVIKQGKNVPAIRGKIKDITDSSLTINGKKIILSKITSISAFRGFEPILLGLSFMAAGPAIFLISDAAQSNSENSYNYSGLGLGFGAILFGIGTTLFGIVETIIIKHYKMDDYILSVKPIPKKSNIYRPFMYPNIF